MSTSIPQKQLTTLVVGDLGNNCYLIKGPVSGKLYIIDPGDEAAVILEAVKKYTWSEAAILLTHAHVDHIQACGKVAQALHIDKVCLDPGDHEMYNSPDNNLLPYMPTVQDLPPDGPFEKNEDFTVLRTPGHSLGSVCLYFPAYKLIFTGDTLFAGSVGRTDLPGGSDEEIMRSIREKLFTLDDDIAVYPGHMQSSTIGEEKRTNPYFI